MTTHNIQLRLQLTGQQAQQQLQRLNLQQNQAQQQQKQNAQQILQTQNRINASIQQGGRYGQQQMRTGQSMLQTNRLLAQILQQQQRSSSLISQQLQQQQRSYQIQLNTLRQQVAAAERLRQQLQQAGQAQQNNQRNGVGGAGGNFMGNTAAVVGGAYAAGSIGSNYLKDPRETKRQISLITGTLYGGEKMSPEQRQQKNMETENWVKEAAVKGGSTIPDVLRALNAFAADPAFDNRELKSVLQEASSTAFASGSDTEAVAKSMIATRRFGISDYKTANDMMFRGGQLGSFEIPDMAQNLPEILSKAKGQYSNDLAGYQKIISNLQVAKYTAATSSQAATNYSNYLGDLDQHHLSLQVAKFITPVKGDIVSKYGVAGKRTGVDFAKGSAKAKLEQGMDQDDYLAHLINREMMQDPLYRQYKQEAKTLKDKIKENQKLGIPSTNEEVAWANRMEGAERIIGNSKFGKIIHNSQSGAYYRAKAAYTEEYDYISSELSADKVKGVKDDEFKHQSDQEYAKDGSFNTARDIAKLNNYNAMSGWLGDLKQGIADFSSSNEGVAAAASAAVVGLTAVAAAGGVAALAMGRGQPPIPPTGRGAGGALGGKVGAASLVAGQVVLSGALGYGIGTEIRDMYMQTETGQKFDDWGGEKIAQFLALFGNDDAQQALESNAKYEQMIAEQQQTNQISKDMVSKLNSLINVTSQNKPIPMNMGGLLGDISKHAATEEKRHGAALLTYKPS